MGKYLLSVNKKIEKIVGVTAKNGNEAKKKILKMIENKSIDFDKSTNDEITFEIYEFYSPSLEKKLTEILGKQVEKRNEKFERITEKFIKENEKEHIEICCEKCGNCTLLDDIIHQLDS